MVPSFLPLSLMPSLVSASSTLWLSLFLMKPLSMWTAITWSWLRALLSRAVQTVESTPPLSSTWGNIKTTSAHSELLCRQISMDLWVIAPPTHTNLTAVMFWNPLQTKPPAVSLTPWTSVRCIFFFLRTRLSHTCNHILNVYLCFSLFFEEYVRKLVVDAH